LVFDLVLDYASRTTVDHDISVFESFREVRDDYEDLPADWPGDETLAFFVQRTDGLFIYAATGCRFIISSGGPPGLLKRGHGAPSKPPAFEPDNPELVLRCLQKNFAFSMTTLRYRPPLRAMEKRDSVCE
jgi:hypothetical protein